MGKAFWALALAGVMITWGASRREKPKGEDYSEMLRLAGLAKYKPPPPSVFKDKDDEEAKIPRKSSLISSGETELGPFIVKVDRRPKTCSVKLYENLDEGRRLLGTWSGDVALCKEKRASVIKAVEQLRSERRGAIIPESLRIKPPKPPKPLPVIIPKTIPEAGMIQEYDVVLSGVVQNTKPIFKISKAREMAKALSVATGEMVKINPRYAGERIETYVRGQHKEAELEARPVVPMFVKPFKAKTTSKKAQTGESNIAPIMKLIRDTPGLTDEERMKLIGQLKGQP